MNIYYIQFINLHGSINDGLYYTFIILNENLQVEYNVAIINEIENIFDELTEA